MSYLWILLPDEPDRDAPVVVCTELPNNPGQSVTNAFEQIAAEVVRGVRCSFLPGALAEPLTYYDGFRRSATRTP